MMRNNAEEQEFLETNAPPPTRLQSTCRQNRNRSIFSSYFYILFLSCCAFLYAHFLLFGGGYYSSSSLSVAGLGYNTELLENYESVHLTEKVTNDARSWDALLTLEKQIYAIQKEEEKIRLEEWLKRKKEEKERRIREQEEQQQLQEQHEENKEGEIGGIQQEEAAADGEDEMDEDGEVDSGDDEVILQQQNDASVDAGDINEEQQEDDTDGTHVATVEEKEKILKSLEEKLNSIPDNIGGSRRKKRRRKTTEEETIGSNSTSSRVTTSEAAKKRALPPFLIVIMICTSIRGFVALMIRLTGRYEDDGDPNNRGLLFRNSGNAHLNPRQRALQRQARIRARHTRIAQQLNAQRIANGERPISVESLSLVLSARDFTGDDYDELLRFHEENGPAVGDLLRSIGATDEEIARCPERVVCEGDELLQLRRANANNNSSGANEYSSSLSSTFGDETTAAGPASAHNATTASSSSSNNTPRQRRGRPQSCAICLEPYAVGDSVRTIPCFHTFHTRCIDPWLSQKAECPVCKYPALG